MRLNSHVAIVSLPLTFALADVGASVGATPAHYVAVGGTLVAIAAVIKAYDWAWNKVGARVQNEIGTALAIHGSQDEVRHAVLRAEIAAVANAVSLLSR